MLLSIYGFSDFVDEINVRIDPARLATAVITGIGFLGAGTILFTGKSITGLTTPRPSGLWGRGVSDWGRLLFCFDRIDGVNST